MLVHQAQHVMGRVVEVFERLEVELGKVPRGFEREDQLARLAACVNLAAFAFEPPRDPAKLLGPGVNDEAGEVVLRHGR